MKSVKKISAITALVVSTLGMAFAQKAQADPGWMVSCRASATYSWEYVTSPRGVEGTVDYNPNGCGWKAFASCDQWYDDGGWYQISTAKFYSGSKSASCGTQYSSITGGFINAVSTS